MIPRAVFGADVPASSASGQVSPWLLAVPVAIVAGIFYATLHLSPHKKAR